MREIERQREKKKGEKIVETKRREKLFVAQEEATRPNGARE